MKKAYFILLCAALAPSLVNADPLTYEVVGETVTVVECDQEASGKVVIPAKYQGKRVTSIADDAFRDCDNIVGVIIPNSVTSIGAGAFWACKNLGSVAIPDSVTNIGNLTFYNCSSLKYVSIGNGITSINGGVFGNCISLLSVILPESVLSIGNYAFQGCSNMKSILMPSVTYIGNSAFNLCRSLTSVTIPDSVSSISAYAFRQCSSLTSVTIPKSVTRIGAGVFSDCSSLKSISVDTRNSSFASRDGVLFNKNKTTLIAYPPGRNTDFTFPIRCTVIGASAFYGCSSLTSVTIPDSITSIGYWAFKGCSKLTSIVIPDSVVSIGRGAFMYCDNLNSVTFSENISVISNSTFFGCSNLVSVTIPDSVIAIESGAFSGCRSLNRALIPESVVSIGSGAFTLCGLNSVMIPDSVVSIGYGAFKLCDNLNSVTISESVVSIESGAFARCSSLMRIEVAEGNSSYTSVDGVLFDKNKKTLIQFPAGKNGQYTIPSSVIRIGDSAFSACSGLTSVTIPESVSSIGSSAFFSCSSLTSVKIPESVSSIGVQAFDQCSSLTSIRIPVSVTTIGAYSFRVCSSLMRIEVAEGNSSYTSVDGVLFDKNKKTLIQFPAGKNGQYTIPNSVIRIGDSAFSACSGLTSVTIPESVSSIGYVGPYTVFASSSLTSISVDINNNSFTSEDGVLFDKDKTSLITYPGGRKNSFYEIPNNVKNILPWAFNYCSDLRTLRIPNTIKLIDKYAFYGCNGLKNIIFDGNAPYIGLENDFYGGPENSKVFVNIGATGFGETFGNFPVIINMTAPTILSMTESLAVNLFHRLKLKVSLIGASPFRYEWKKDGKVIPNAVTSSLIIDRVTPVDAGIYSVVVINEFGIASRKVNVTIVSPETRLKIVSHTTSPFSLSFESQSDSTYKIEASHDLKEWGEIGEARGTGGIIKFTDWREAIFEKQFYRLKVVE